MRKLLLLLSTFLVVLYSYASDSDYCRILYNKKIIFKGKMESDNPVASLKVRNVKKTDSITIMYNTKNDDKRWKRLIYINDSSNQNLKTLELNEQTGKVSVNASVIKNTIENKQPFFIYITSLPKDKALAARVRVRRILLCKIEWN